MIFIILLSDILIRQRRGFAVISAGCPAEEVYPAGVVGVGDVAVVGADDVVLMLGETPLASGIIIVGCGVGTICGVLQVAFGETDGMVVGIHGKVFVACQQLVDINCDCGNTIMRQWDAAF